MRPDVDDYLQQGIHGEKEINPEERRQFLGTLRERVVIALKQAQLMEPGIYPEVETALKGNKNAHLYLNGNMSYEYLSKYKKIADKFDLEYTIVTNKEYDSELGLVLAYDYAIDKESIYVEKKVTIDPPPKKKGFFGKLFGN
ncbi:YueI family protein [Robertmurraya korlensis]|uniref:YueI family protein n=1 Tax=Robertmurraya korlensis TaxID=519977 RepID=UPI0008240CFE|nr:YueI family protein [Robertmurraya korlensis]